MRRVGSPSYSALFSLLLVFATAQSVLGASNFKTSMQAGWDAFSSGDFDTAIKHYQKAFKKADDEKDKAFAAKSIGVLLLRLGERPQARKQLEIACALDPENTQYWTVLAVTYDASEKKVEALENAVRVDPDNVLALSELGKWYLDSRFKKWDKAVDVLQRAVSLTSSPKKQAVLAQRLAFAYMKTNNEKNAIKWLKKIVRDHPASSQAPMAALDAGMTLLSQAKGRAEGERLVRRSCEMLLENPIFWNLNTYYQWNFAVECGRRGYYEVQAPLYLRLLGQYPRDPVLLAKLGWTYYFWGRLDQAEEFFKLAVALAESADLPVALRGYEGLMKIYRERGNKKVMDELLDKARTTAAKILRRHPNVNVTYETHAAVLAAHGSGLKRAAKLARKAVSLKPDMESLYKLGLVLLKQGKAKEAISSFHKALKAGGPPGAVVYWSLGKAYRAMGKKKSARRSWRKGLKINPRHRLILAELGRRPPRPKKRSLPARRESTEEKSPKLPGYAPSPFQAAASKSWQSGDYAGALTQYKMAFEKARNKPEKARAAKSIGIMYKNAGDFENAEDFFEKAAKLNQADAETLYLLSVTQRKNPRKAMKTLRTMVRRFPNSFVGWYWLGRYYADPFGKSKKSIRALKRALEIAAVSGQKIAAEYKATAMYILGSLYNNADRPTEALRWYEKLTREHPNSQWGPVATAYTGSLRILEKQGSLAEGQKLYRQACERLMTSPAPQSGAPLASGSTSETYLWFSKICFSHGYYDAANYLLQHLFVKNPGDPEVLGLLGYLHYTKGDFGQAKPYLQRLAKTPSAWQAYEGFAWVYRDTKDEQSLRRNLEEGLRVGEAAMRSYRRVASPYASVANMLAASGVQFKRAEKLARKAVRLSGSAQNYTTLGYVLIQRGKPREAIPLLRKANDLSRGLDAIVYWHMGRAYRGLGNQEKARKAWRQGLEVDPHHRLILAELGERPERIFRKVKYVESVGAAPAAPGATPDILRLAVLPMDSFSLDLDAPNIVRFWFHNRLVRKGHKVISLEKTDKLLKKHFGITDGGQLAAVSVAELGKILDVHAVIYGTVEAFGMINVGFARQRKVEVRFHLKDVKSGRQRWESEGRAVTADVTFKTDVAAKRFVGGLVDEWTRKIKKSIYDDEAMEAVRQSIKSFPMGAY